MVKQTVIRLTALITAVTLLIGFCFPPLPSHAYYDEETGTYYFRNYEDVYNLARWYLANCGYVITGDWEGLHQNARFLDWCNNVLANENEEYFRTEKGQLAVTNKAANELTEAAREVVATDKGGTASGSVTGDYGDFYVVPTYSYADFWQWFHNIDWFQGAWPTVLYDKFYSKLYSLNMCVMRWGTVYNNKYCITLYDEDVSDYVFIGNSSRFGMYSPSTFLEESSFAVTHYPYGYTFISSDEDSFYSGNNYFYIKSSDFNPSSPVDVNKSQKFRSLFTKTGENVRIYKSIVKARSYLSGASSTTNKYYTSNRFYNYNENNDNSITINKETVQYITQGDFSTDYNTTYTTIFNNISDQSQSESGITESQMQAIINDALTQLTTQKPSEPESPSESESSSGGGNEDPENPSGTGSDGPQTLSWLEKIYNKLADTLTYLEEGITDALKAIKNAITANTIAEVAGTLIDLLKDLVAGGKDSVGGFVENVGNALSPAAELLPEKFPTCIPWDLVALFTILQADASPPVYEVPFVVPSLGIDETMTLDLSEFDSVSEISRMLLGLMFVLFLMLLTFKIVGDKGGGD